MNRQSLITVSGADAFEFLQGQLTNDLRRLDAEASVRAAWCNPKGRVLCLLRVSRIDDGYSLQLPTELAEDIVKRLTMFRFRSKVEFAIEDAGVAIDPAQLIHDGIPFIGPQQTEQFTPHMLNLDLLDAISLDKGCYTGQEIVARTHYKGTTKRRAMRFESEQPVAVGDTISLDGRDIGEVLNVSGNDMLAVVPVDKASHSLTANGIALRQRPLPYME